MSGIAELLLNLGFRVSGSDLKVGEVCRRLQKLGAQISQGHARENVPESASLLVYSSAVRSDNVELIEAHKRGLPVIRRAEVLSELMRLKYGVAVAGSHGKTTTTSMIAAVMERAGLDPTAVIGGQVSSIGSGSKLGRGEFLIAESDESDKSFLLLKPSIAVVTNIDAEHLCAYESFTELEESFESFVKGVPFYGLSVFCIDDPRVRALAQRYERRQATYGVSLDALYRAVNIVQRQSGSSFDVLRQGEFLCRVNLPLIGRHMVVNSLAAVAVGVELNIAPDVISTALHEFLGVKRRLEVVGACRSVAVMSDYGHHPTEVRATLRAVREAWGSSIRKFHVIFQPHRYSRTRDCFAEYIQAFQDCDHLVLCDIYPAGEDPIAGISGELLFAAISHLDKEFSRSLDGAAACALAQAAKGDLVLCLGAGSIGTLPEEILARLASGPPLEQKAANLS